MSYLRKIISGLLVLCMVFSMLPPAGAEEAAPRDGRIMLGAMDLAGESTVWVDGIAYSVLGLSLIHISEPTRP